MLTCLDFFSLWIPFFFPIDSKGSCHVESGFWKVMQSMRAVGLSWVRKELVFEKSRPGW